MGSAELAVLAVLLLGGVQTVTQVRARAQRLHPLITPVEVEALLDTLAARTPRPFAARVPTSAAETRWVQVLTGPVPRGTDGDGERDRSGDAGTPARGGAVVPADVAAPGYAALVARVADLEQRLAAALEGRGRAPGDWAPAPYPPPPPPPVEVSPPPRQIVTRPAERRYEARPAARPVGPAVDVDLDDLSRRMADIERRLARIEAELGALR